MSFIDRRFSSFFPSRRSHALARFWRARREMNLALLEWLREEPDPDDVALEVDGTVAAVRQLAMLAKEMPLPERRGQGGEP